MSDLKTSPVQEGFQSKAKCPLSSWLVEGSLYGEVQVEQVWTSGGGGYDPGVLYDEGAGNEQIWTGPCVVTWGPHPCVQTDASETLLSRTPLREVKRTSWVCQDPVTFYHENSDYFTRQKVSSNNLENLSKLCDSKTLCKYIFYFSLLKLDNSHVLPNFMDTQCNSFHVSWYQCCFFQLNRFRSWKHSLCYSIIANMNVTWSEGLRQYSLYHSNYVVTIDPQCWLWRSDSAQNVQLFSVWLHLSLLMTDNL